MAYTQNLSDFPGATVESKFQSFFSFLLLVFHVSKHFLIAHSEQGTVIDQEMRCGGGGYSSRGELVQG